MILTMTFALFRIAFKRCLSGETGSSVTFGRSSMSHIHSLLLNAYRLELGKFSTTAEKKASDEARLKEFLHLDSRLSRERRGALDSALLRQVEEGNSLEDAVDEHRRIQIELKNALKQLEGAKLTKSNDLTQLELVMRKIRDRDADLEDMAKEYLTSVTRSKEKAQSVAMLRESIGNTKRINSKRSTEIADAMRSVARLSEEADREETMVELTQQRVGEAALALSDQERAAERKYLELKDSLKSLADVRLILEQREAKFKAQKSKLDLISDGAVSKEHQVDDARRLLEESTSVLGSIENSLREAKDSLYSETLRLRHAEEVSATMKLQVEGHVSRFRQLKGELGKLEVEKSKIDQTLFALDYEHASYMAKLEALTGSSYSSQSEKEELTQKLGELEAQLKETQSVHAMLASQQVRKQAELKNSKRELDMVVRECDSVAEKLREAENENGSIDRAEGIAYSSKGEALVARDGYMADLNAVREKLKADISQLFSVQSVLDSVSAELDVKNSHTELDAERMRLANRELGVQRHSLALRLGAETQKNSQLEIQLEHLVRKRQGADEEHSQAYAVIKAAQAKEELLTIHAQLEASLETAKQEFSALQFAEQGLSQGNASFLLRTNASLAASRMSSHSEADAVMKERIRNLKAKENALAVKIAELESFIPSSQPCEEIVRKLEGQVEEAENSLEPRYVLGLHVAAIETGLRDMKASIAQLVQTCPTLYEYLRQNLLLKGIEM